ncbi:MAG: hypothetical protein IJ489_11410 [Clostridia bacterium]|nr:hypothetical protein [Clostridia bacterium]
METRRDLKLSFPPSNFSKDDPLSELEHNTPDIPNQATANLFVSECLSVLTEAEKAFLTRHANGETYESLAKDFGYQTASGVPAIVPEDIFNLATSMVETNERAPARKKAKEERIKENICREQLQNTFVTEDHIWYIFDQFRKMDLSMPDQQKKIIDSFLHSIVLYDDRLVISFNYREHPKTIMLDDI